MLVGNYEVSKRIGAGSYGSVYRAKDIRIPESEDFCLKKIDMACCSVVERESAMCEASLLASCRHPSVVQYHDHFLHDDHLCVVMALCQGGDLFTEIKARSRVGGHFSEMAVLDLFVQAAEALDFVHSKRILHRDLKTANLFIDEPSGSLMLGDFGIAKQLEGSCAATVVGTPYYMSPELCRGDKYGYKSDVWALGCVLHELCSLRPAFHGTNILGVIYQIVESEPPALPPHYSAELCDLVRSLLTKDAHARPSLQQVLDTPLVREARERRRPRDSRAAETACSAGTESNSSSCGDGGGGGGGGGGRRSRIGSRPPQRRDAFPRQSSRGPIASAAVEEETAQAAAAAAAATAAEEASGLSRQSSDETPVASEQIQLGDSPFRATVRRRASLFTYVSTLVPMRKGGGAKGGGGEARESCKYKARRLGLSPPKSRLPYSFSPTKKTERAPDADGRRGGQRRRRRFTTVEPAPMACATGAPPELSLGHGLACAPAEGSGSPRPACQPCHQLVGSPAAPRLDTLLAEYAEEARQEGRSPARPDAGADDAQAEWYYLDRAHAEQGPVDEELLLLMHACGDIDDRTLVWHQKQAGWVPLGNLPGLFST